MNTPNTTVYISNLSYKADRAILRSMFSPFGTIKAIKIIVEPETEQSRGMAFVEMGTVAQAKEAIETLDGQVFSGRTVKVRAAIPQAGTSTSRRSPVAAKKKKDENRDLAFAEIQLEKKARNESKRKANPIVMKYVPSKKA